MANNLFSRAKAYCKAHPRTSYQHAIKKLSGKGKKKAAVGKKPHKKAVKKAIGRKPRKAAVKKAAPVARKLKIKVKPGKKSSTLSFGISGISLNKVKQELQHQHALVKAREKHKEAVKAKGLKATEKAALRRDINHYTNAINSSKKHVSALKRSI